MFVAFFHELKSAGLPVLGGVPAVALVIAGALANRDGYHEPGDIVFAGPGVGLTAEGEVDCICFVAPEEAAKPPGRIGRMFQRVMGGCPFGLVYWFRRLPARGRLRA